MKGFMEPSKFTGIIIFYFHIVEIITYHEKRLKLCFEGYMYTERCGSSSQIQWQCSHRFLSVMVPHTSH